MNKKEISKTECYNLIKLLFNIADKIENKVDCVFVTAQTIRAETTAMIAKNNRLFPFADRFAIVHDNKQAWFFMEDQLEDLNNDINTLVDVYGFGNGYYTEYELKFKVDDYGQRYCEVTQYEITA